MTQTNDADRSSLGKPPRYEDLLFAGTEEKPERGHSCHRSGVFPPIPRRRPMILCVSFCVRRYGAAIGSAPGDQTGRGGHLSDDQVERLGMTLLQLEQRMTEIKSLFGLENEDLTLRIGSLQDLMDVSTEEIGSFE